MVTRFAYSRIYRTVFLVCLHLEFKFF